MTTVQRRGKGERKRKTTMDGKVCKNIGVKFIFLILTLSGGFGLVLSETLSLQNVTQSVGYNVVIECHSDSMNFTNQPSWFKYDNGKILIYNASSLSNSNSSKYLVDTGNNTLTVMEVQFSDAATYCCNAGDLVDYCSNVVVIGSDTESVKPIYNVKIGDTVNLTCSISYNAPTKDPAAPFPLSDDQDPQISMFIGEEEVSVEQTVDVDTVPHRKTITFNKTVEVADLDRDLDCRVWSTKFGRLTGARVRIAHMDIVVIYPNNAESSKSEYKVNDVFQCIADRFPFVEATWTDITTPSTPRIISTGIGNATAKILAAGKYVWTCSIITPLKTIKISRELIFTGSAEVKFTLPILLTAGCLLVIACVVDS